MASEASRTPANTTVHQSLEERMATLSLNEISAKDSTSHTSSQKIAFQEIAFQVFSQESQTLSSTQDHSFSTLTEHKSLDVEGLSTESSTTMQQSSTAEDSCASNSFQTTSDLLSYSPPLSKNSSSNSSTQWVVARKNIPPNVNQTLYLAYLAKKVKSKKNEALPPTKLSSNENFTHTPPIQYNSFSPLTKKQKEKALKATGQKGLKIELLPLGSSTAIKEASSPPSSPQTSIQKKWDWMIQLIPDWEDSENETSLTNTTNTPLSSHTETESSLSSRSESSSPSSLTQWKIVQKSFNPYYSYPRFIIAANRLQGAYTKTQWLKILSIDWVRNTQQPKGFIANALILKELMKKKVLEENFCTFIRNVSHFFYLENREGLKEEAEGIYRDMKAKFLRGNFDPFYEIIVHPTLCNLSGGIKTLLSLYRKVSAKGNPKLLFTLAGFCLNGWETRTKDKAEALRLYKLAAAQGHPGAIYSLGKILHQETKSDASASKVSSITKRKIKNPFQYYRKEANKGNPEAQFILARVCLNGWETGTKNKTEAFYLYKLAAAHGYRQALSMMQLIQKEMPKEDPPTKSMLYIKQAADLGYIKAQRTYSHFLLDTANSYCRIDYAKYSPLILSEQLRNLWLFSTDDYATCYNSTTFYIIHAFKENHFAQYALAQCYELGIGIEQNITEAINWYEQSAAFGNQEAQKALTRLCSKKVSPTISPKNEEREKRLINLASEWKKNLGLFGDEKKNAQLLITLFQVEKVTEQEFANFFINIDSIDRKNSWVLSHLYEKFVRLTESKTLNPIYALGQCYLHGLGVPANEEKAFELSLKAAKEGNANAQISVGESFYSGIGTPLLPAKSKKWLEKAAQQGTPDAFFALGVYYERGIGGKTDLKQAAILFKEAANRGHTKALLKFGKWLENGINVSQNPNEAFRLYTTVANQGYTTGLFELGRCYGHGIGVNKDPILAIECFRKAAEQGNIDGQHLYSMYLSSLYTLFEILYSKPIEEALRYLKAAAESGHPKIQLEVGLLYMRGTIVEKDIQKTLSYFQMAEETKDPKVITALAQIYEKGEGLPKNLVKAKKLYRYATLKGNVQAKKAYSRLNCGLVPIDLSSKEQLPL